MNKPDFIIIGAMKSATSTLHEQLALQPGIFMSSPKEPNFFSDDEIFAKGNNWYQSLFENAAADDLCGESSTHYTKLPDYPHTLSRMQSALPIVKCVYVIRHPIERLVSHYIHQWSQNVIRTDINSAIDTFPELINYSLYSMQIKPYIEAYGRENIQIVFSEGIRHHPERELRRVSKFIGYSGEAIWHETLPEQNVSNQRLRKFRGYKVLVDNPVMTFIRKTFVPQRLRNFVKRRLVMKKRPVINLQQMKMLEEIFDKDLKTLGEMTGMSLSLTSYQDIAKNGDISLIVDRETV